MAAPAHRPRTALVWTVALLSGFALRAIPLTAARPYIHYVDEGHLLHSTFAMIRNRTWDPDEFTYPQFPRLVIAAAARSLDAIVASAGGVPLRNRIPDRHDTYDELEPFEFLLLARVLSLAVGMFIVVLTGLFACRLVGPTAGAAAALLAAFVPALALRGSIASVDSWATLATLACLYLTDVTRTAQRPRAVAFAAGCFAGVAFASKYPAVLVAIAFAVTTILLPITVPEKARRLLLCGGGVIVGALTAMPALWRHAAEIPNVLRDHWQGYAHAVFEPSLWRQALIEAESDLYYGGPELGVVFCVLAFGGLIRGFRQRPLIPTVVGWCAFAAVMFGLFARHEFRPFRNLMPLIPLACVAASIAFAWLHGRSPRPGLVDAVGGLALLLLYGLPMAAHARQRFDLVDSRGSAIDWLARSASPGDTTAYLGELAILNGEIARVPGTPRLLNWDEAPSRIRAEAPRFVVAGQLLLPDHSLHAAEDWPELAGYRQVLHAGQKPTVPYPHLWWHGNDEIIVVYERRQPR